MTETEWLDCTDPKAMLDLLNEKHKASPRKLRLVVCAWVRRVWNEVIRYGPEYCVWMDAAERCADEPDDAERWQRFAQAEGRGDNFALFAVLSASRAVASNDNATILQHALEASKMICACIWEYTPLESEDADERFSTQQANDAAELVRQCNLIRDVFDNPFRRGTFKHAWRKPEVVELAKMLYDRRAFDCLPGLADVLVQKRFGCKNADILNHCRQPGEHVRGCWALDLILGKE